MEPTSNAASSLAQLNNTMNTGSEPFYTPPGVPPAQALPDVAVATYVPPQFVEPKTFTAQSAAVAPLSAPQATTSVPASTPVVPLPAAPQSVQQPAPATPLPSPASPMQTPLQRMNNEMSYASIPQPRMQAQQMVAPQPNAIAPTPVAYGIPTPRGIQPQVPVPPQMYDTMQKPKSHMFLIAVSLFVLTVLLVLGLLYVYGSYLLANGAPEGTAATQTQSGQQTPPVNGFQVTESGVTEPNFDQGQATSPSGVNTNVDAMFELPPAK
jgi:hypothetical protein